MSTIKIVILVAVVIVVVIFGLSRSGVLRDRVPADVAGRKMTVIDVESLELREVTMIDWEQRFEFDNQTGYKIDNRGRKLSELDECASCGEKVPLAPVPTDIVDPEERSRIISEYICPHCGE